MYHKVRVYFDLLCYILYTLDDDCFVWIWQHIIDYQSGCMRFYPEDVIEVLPLFFDDKNLKKNELDRIVTGLKDTSVKDVNFDKFIKFINKER